MRRLFIMRKDLHMSPGKLAAQVGHCAEIYWLNIITGKYEIQEDDYAYINDRITKTVCEAKNLYQLMKAVDIAKELGLIEGRDYGLINDACFTELIPENEDGTCTTGIWFRPLEDEVAHKISKKYQLYKEEN